MNLLQCTPSQPYVTSIGSDTMTINWKSPDNFQKEDYFQVFMKETSKGKWKGLPEEYNKSPAVINDLKGGTTYTFRVRAIYDDSEGPYSPESEQYTTAISPAKEIIKFCELDEKGNPSPDIFIVPITESLQARNPSYKLRKMEIGMYLEVHGKMILRHRHIIYIHITR